jgi:hypothetical protein
LERLAAGDAGAELCWPAAEAAELAATTRGWATSGEAGELEAADELRGTAAPAAALAAVRLDAATVGDAGGVPSTAPTVPGGTADPTNPRRPWMLEVRSDGFVGTPS